VTEATPDPTAEAVTVREQMAQGLIEVITMACGGQIQEDVIPVVVAWAQKMTLRDLTLEYTQEAQRLYAEAERVHLERTPVAYAYGLQCRRRADAYTQAAAMIHQTVETRWPPACEQPMITPSDGDAESPQD